MTGRAVLLAFLGAAACGDKAIDLDLRAANAPGASTIDLSCVDSVAVYAYGHNLNDVVTNCAQIDPSGDRTLDRLDIAGALSMPTPTSGLETIFLSGMSETCNGPTAFYGGTAYDGGDTLTVYVYPNLSCDRRIATPTAFHVIDFLTLLDSATCAPIANGFSLMAGTIHNDPTAGISYFEQSTAPIGVVDGIASISGMYSRAEGSTCLAGGLLSGATLVATGCVYPDLAGACVPAGEFEMAYVDSNTLDAATDSTHALQFGTTTLVAIWDSVAHHAIAGATVTVKHGEADLVYTTYAAGAFSPTTATATGPTGTLTFYSSAPAEVDVAAPGYRTRTLYLGADGFALAGNATVITLGR